MKKLITIFFVLSLCVAQFVFANRAVSQQEGTIRLHGRILAADTGNPLANASIVLANSSISSVSNQDGYFSIRVPQSAQNSRLLIRYLGYENKEIAIASLRDKPDNQILLQSSPIALKELQVLSGDGRQLMQSALRKVYSNYSAQPNMMVAFYRESIKKGSNYISLVEAVLDIYKASYRSYQNDQAKIYIGRKASDASPRDTVLLKFQGGINTALLLDIAKNPSDIFYNDGEDYNFQIKQMIHINNKPHYAIYFSPKSDISEILFRGMAYIDAETHAFSKIDFQMNVEDRKDAAQIFIRKKPNKMRVAVEKAAYVVDYIENNGQWIFNYSSVDLVFKVRWSNRFFGLFATEYNIRSELAITDVYNREVDKFPRDERIRSTDVIAEKVEYFQNPDFWGDYNVIEPDIAITNAIKKLSDKLHRRTE